MVPGYRRSRAAISALFFVNGTLFATWVCRIPGVKDALALSEGHLGLALLAMGLGTFAALPLTSGRIARHGSARVATASALACCAAVPLAGAAPSLPWLAAALALTGAALGSMDVAMNSQAAGLERAAGRSIMASFHGLWSLGGLVGAALGGGLASRGYAPLTHFLAVGALLTLVVLGVARALAGDVPPRTPASPLAWPSHATLTIGIVGACGAVVEGGIADWSGVYLREALGAGAGFAAGGFGAFSLAMMAGRFTGDGLIRRFGRAAVLRAGSALTGGAMAVALLGGSPSLALGAFAVAGLGMSVVFPIAFSAAGSVADTTPERGIAAVATMAYGGGLLGPPLIGFAASATSLTLALGTLVVACLVIAGLAGRVD